MGIDPFVADALLAVIMLLLGFLLRRIFTLYDRISSESRLEDRRLHERITEVQTTYLTKHDFDQAATRIIDAINRLESKIDK